MLPALYHNSNQCCVINPLSSVLALSDLFRDTGIFGSSPSRGAACATLAENVKELNSCVFTFYTWSLDATTSDIVFMDVFSFGNRIGFLSSFVRYGRVGFGAWQLIIPLVLHPISSGGNHSVAFGNLLLLLNGLISMVAIQINGCKFRTLTELEPNLQWIFNFDSEFFKSYCNMFNSYQQFDLSWLQIHRIYKRGVTCFLISLCQIIRLVLHCQLHSFMLHRME